ncbi:MAG: DUF4249 family protein [Chitinophagales bacterium]
MIIPSYYTDDDGGLMVELTSTDRSTFLYNESLRIQNNTEGNPFAEPAPVFNNIEMGYGIFGSRVIARDSIY